MKDVYAKRLLKLADFLQALPRKRFDFNDWTSNGTDLNECGTSACALGWATAMPAFRRLGARLTPSGSPTLEQNGASPSDVSDHLFGLSYDQHRYLFVFGLNPNATPKQAAKHIRAFVKSERERADQKGSEAK